MKRLRKERGWSQEALGDEAGLDRTYISGIERIVRNLLRMCLRLDVRDLDVIQCHDGPSSKGLARTIKKTIKVMVLPMDSGG